jgi:hypothetical protein
MTEQKGLHDRVLPLEDPGGVAALFREPGTVFLEPGTTVERALQTMMEGKQLATLVENRAAVDEIFHEALKRYTEIRARSDGHFMRIRQAGSLDL